MVCEVVDEFAVFAVLSRQDLFELKYRAVLVSVRLSWA